MGNTPFLDFDGKKVVVTGASSGIGRAISIELSQHGAGLILIGRNRERLQETAAGLSNGEHNIICLDLTQHSEIVPAIRELAQQGERIYGLCHCAGIVETRPLSSYKVEGLSAMLDVNLIAGIELTRRNIRVNTLSPGFVRTPMTEEALAKLSEQQVKKIEDAHPLGTGTPEDVARAAAFLLAPTSAWITGTDLVIDGGYSAQ